MTYYLYIENKQVGPLAFEEVTKYKLIPSTKVWREDQAAWKEAKEFDELKNYIQKTPPPFPHVPPPVSEKQAKKIKSSSKKQFRSGNSGYWKYWPVIILLVAMLIGFYALRVYQAHNRQLQRDVQQYQMQQEYERIKKQNR